VREFREGRVALYSGYGYESKSKLDRVMLRPEKAVVITIDGI
jgi:hypothetical protein